MSDYDQQKWFDLYKTALLELKRAAMTGRIGDARTEITTRLETLKLHPHCIGMNTKPSKTRSTISVY